MACQATDTIIDITRRLEWEVSKEQLESGESVFRSPKFKVKFESQVSNWTILICTRFRRPNVHKTDESMALILVSMQAGDVSLDVEVERIGAKTENGYIAGKPFQAFQGIFTKMISKAGKPFQAFQGIFTKMISKIEHFDGRSQRHERVCATDAGSTEDFFKMSNGNKITLVATLRFYMDRNVEKNKREKNFHTHLRTIPDLDTLTDFTIICGDRQFKCHRVILASRSTVFKTMLLNDRFVENHENSVSIENSSPDTVEAMLEFISKGVVPRDIGEKAIDLIDLADRYDLQDLIEICESSLVNNLTAESVIETLIAIDLHVPNSQRRQRILDFIKAEAARVVKSSHWKEFLVKYPDLVAEIFLWAALPPGEANDN